MLDSHPPHSPGRLVGLGLIGILVLIDIGLLVFAVISPLGILTVIFGLLILASLPLIGIVIYVTAGISNTKYRVEGSLLVVEWGRLVQAIPLPEISEIISGEAISGIDDFRGVRWPGCMIGQGLSKIDASRHIKTAFYATRTVDEQVLIVTEAMAYGLSPADPFAFTASLKALMESDLGEDQASAYSQMDILDWSLWPDRPALIVVGLAGILNLALFAFLAVIFSQLPDEVALHFNSAGSVDRVGPPSGLFILPIIGLVTWIVAVILGWYFYYLRQEKPVAYIIWGVTVGIELTAWIAVIGLIL